MFTTDDLPRRSSQPDDARFDDMTRMVESHLHSPLHWKPATGTGMYDITAWASTLGLSYRPGVRGRRVEARSQL